MPEELLLKEAQLAIVVFGLLPPAPETCGTHPKFADKQRRSFYWVESPSGWDLLE